MITENKKSYWVKIIFVFILLFSLFTTKTYADSKWFYAWSEPSTGGGISGAISGLRISPDFDTKADCETSRAKVDVSKKPTLCTEKNPAITTKVIDVDAVNNKVGDNNTYKLLAPINDLKEITTTNGIGDYLGKIFFIAIGLCGALAVIMLVIGGIQYMGNESVFGKTEAKGRMLSAILGLLIALGAYAILYTLNPDLTGINGVTVDQVSVGVVDSNDVPEGGDIGEAITDTEAKSGKLPGIKCASGSSTQGFCMFGTYDNPKPTGEIPTLISFLKSNPSYKITKINIIPIPGAKNEKFVFTTTTGRQFSTFGIGHGGNGWSNGDGHEGDKKTPYGTYKIINHDKASNQNTVIRSTRTDKSGVGYSMGGAKFNLDSRGIAIHSNRKNSQGTSAACILMYNDDLFALYPYVWMGLPVVIGS